MDHIFPLRALSGWLWVPLPVIGSTYPIARRSGLYHQDLSSGDYTRLRDSLQGAFRENPPLVYVSGHEHNLQVMKRAERHYLLVSGAGIMGHGDRVATVPSTLFASSNAGFMQLDVLRDGRVRLLVLTAEKNGKSTPRFSTWLE
jgi:hypothetical protein